MADDDLKGATRGNGERRAAVLDAALRAFTRFGYQKTSMNDVAREAQISRPGLYFLFASKSDLFRAAAERGVAHDLEAAQHALAEPGRSLPDRLVDAFDRWAGRYVGPMQDVTAILNDNTGLLGPIALAGPDCFETLLMTALEECASVAEPHVTARTLISVSLGIKYQAGSREEYVARMTDAVSLITGH